MGRIETLDAPEPSVARLQEGREGFIIREVPRIDEKSRRDFDASAQDVDKSKDKESEVKKLSGMSIVGKDEAPKSLYIVPWKSSEL